MQSADLYVSILIILVIVIWAAYRFNHWLNAPLKRFPFEDEESSEIEMTAAAELLEGEGYEIVSGKRRISMNIETEDESFASSLWVDYFVRMDDEIFVVKTSRRRKPVDWTGSGLRERFLPYFLIYDDLAGVIYIDMDKQMIRTIKFNLER